MTTSVARAGCVRAALMRAGEHGKATMDDPIRGDLRARLTNLRASQLALPTAHRFSLQVMIEQLQADALSAESAAAMRMIQPAPHRRRLAPALGLYVVPLRQEA